MNSVGQNTSNQLLSYPRNRKVSRKHISRLVKIDNDDSRSRNFQYLLIKRPKLIRWLLDWYNLGNFRITAIYRLRVESQSVQLLYILNLVTD